MEYENDNDMQLEQAKHHQLRVHARSRKTTFVLQKQTREGGERGAPHAEICGNGRPGRTYSIETGLSETIVF